MFRSPSLPVRPFHGQGAVLLLGLLLARLAIAAAPAPAPAVYITAQKNTGGSTTVQQQTGRLEYTNKGYVRSADGSMRPINVASGNQTKTSDQHESVWYSITVRNTGKVPIDGVTVTYHLYIKTFAGGNNGSTATVSDYTETKSLNLGPTDVQKFDTSPIDHLLSTSTQVDAGTRKAPAANVSTTQTISNTNVMGYYIEATVDGLIIGKTASPDDIKDKLKNYTITPYEKPANQGLRGGGVRPATTKGAAGAARRPTSPSGD